MTVSAMNLPKRQIGLVILLALTGLLGFSRARTLGEGQGQPREHPLTKSLVKLVQFQVRMEPAAVKPGETFKMILEGKVKDKFHTFPITQKAPDQIQVTDIEFKTGPGVKALPPLQESNPEFHKETDGSVLLEHRGTFRWSQEYVVLPEAKPGEQTIKALISNIQVCNDTNCIGPAPYRDLEGKITIQPAAGNVELSKEIKTKLDQKQPRPQVIPLPAEFQRSGNNETPGKNAKSPPTTGQTNIPGTNNDLNSGGLFGLLWAAAAGAFLMLLTPCVFPMIPITVNFFIKQSEKEHHNALLSASVYSGTIIFLLTAIILVFGNVVIHLANNAWFNLALGGVLIFFALSLFGMYEIELPSSLSRFTSAREGQGGYMGTVFMALTFTITSFTCTGPFLGVLLAPVAGLRPPLPHLILAALVYSTVFAAPFFLLALFPTLLKKLPSSGSWMNAIKVTMGFLELAAALKFLANTDIAWNPGSPLLFNFDTVLCAWIALSVACGLYLIGAYRLPHDSEVESIGVVRMIFASIFLGMAVYLSPLLFGIKPEGVIADGVVSFLPPKFRENPARGGGGGSELAWTRNFEDAWQEASKDKKLIFIDFTGVNCTNCRFNENNVFPNPKVHDLLKKYARLQLYTDTVPTRGLSSQEAKDQALRNLNWQEALLNDLALPAYLVFRPDPKKPFNQDGTPNGVVLGKVTGTINDVPGFIKFLEDPLKTEKVASLPEQNTNSRQVAKHSSPTIQAQPRGLFPQSTSPVELANSLK